MWGPTTIASPTRWGGPPEGRDPRACAGPRRTSFRSTTDGGAHAVDRALAGRGPTRRRSATCSSPGWAIGSTLMRSGSSRAGRRVRPSSGTRRAARSAGGTSRPSPLPPIADIRGGASGGRQVPLRDPGRLSHRIPARRAAGAGAIADLNASGAELVIQLGDITDHGNVSQSSSWRRRCSPALKCPGPP